MTIKQTRRHHSIGERIRTLRLDRRWTQKQLAELLGISQNYLSELERGQGSFTADHLLTILKTFNVPIDYFSPAKTEGQDQIQSALARFGASHLFEPADTIPSVLFKEVTDAVREALISAESSRQIAALAPVLVDNINRINLKTLQAQFLEIGLGQRLGWALENTLEAIHHELSQPLPHAWKLKYHRAEVILKSFLSLDWPGRRVRALRASLVDFSDVLDHDIASDKSLAEARRESSEISKRWGITTRIQTDDFIQALRAARETHP
ncbi:MAG TPA: helix-turn-helix transcriptional regulator [Elusimicrobiota bacterium]|nr:helix-turn-helix transcriptional regulator [Elusimicrobiota bacterium]